MTSTIERLATGEELRAIADPEQRLKAAAEVAAHADAAAEPYRLRRNAAAVELFRTSGEPAVRVWHDTLDVSRTLWGRILSPVKPDTLARLRAKQAELERRGLARKAATVRRRIERAETLLAAIDNLRAEVAELSGGDLTEALRAIASEAAEKVRELDALGEQAQEVRNETARGLMNREYGYILRNAEVARLAQLTTARVAQLRTSY